MSDAVLETGIAGYSRRQGKVRDIYDLGDQLLLIATDRISAFDVVIPNGIPQKGILLTLISEFWFNKFADVPNHFLRVVRDQAPPGLEGQLEQIRGRSTLCRKCEVIPIECVVRGYISGSGWRDYQRTQSVCGIGLPAGLQLSQKLAEPIFTPSTKASEGHDENISFETACGLVGTETMRRLRDRSIALYQRASDYALERGLIIADTKFEWGRTSAGELLIDEILTPDSSRLWPLADYEPDREQVSLDKQYVREHLQLLCDQGQWDKTPPAPCLPPDVVANTTRKYIEVYEQLTGRSYLPTAITGT